MRLEKGDPLHVSLYNTYQKALKKKLCILFSFYWCSWIWHMVFTWANHCSLECYTGLGWIIWDKREEDSKGTGYNIHPWGKNVFKFTLTSCSSMWYMYSLCNITLFASYLLWSFFSPIANRKRLESLNLFIIIFSLLPHAHTKEAKIYL